MNRRTPKARSGCWQGAPRAQCHSVPLFPSYRRYSGAERLSLFRNGLPFQTEAGVVLVTGQPCIRRAWMRLEEQVEFLLRLPCYFLAFRIAVHGLDPDEPPAGVG